MVFKVLGMKNAMISTTSTAVRLYYGDLKHAMITTSSTAPLPVAYVSDFTIFEQNFLKTQVYPRAFARFSHIRKSSIFDDFEPIRKQRSTTDYL